ncbi:MAG: NmrA family NAD(P)-binding protein [Sneathiella sp.]
MSNQELFVVTGASGRTGASTARALLEAGKRVRVVVRDAAKGNYWATRGAEVAIAELSDVQALKNALLGADGAYIISPSQYSSDTLFAQAGIMADAIAKAAVEVHLPKIVALSSIGADQTDGTGWIAMNRILEQSLGQIEIPVTFLRPAYFMENWNSVASIAATQNILPSFLSPLDQKTPMIATADIGLFAAAALQEIWSGVRIIELEGPSSYSPNDVAEAFSFALKNPVDPKAIPQSDWAQMLPQGFSPTAIIGFIEMTQGLNSKHITFTGKSNVDRRRGSTPLETIVATMLRS